jgi:thiamine-monophosphate kinase
VRLDGARPGDTVAVVGELGRSAAGYALWRNDINAFDELRRRHLVPRVPYGHGRSAADAGATSMTDVSDGLIADLAHIARASDRAIDVSRDLLQIDHDAVTPAAAVLRSDPWAWVLSGGEDHALVATFAGAPPTGWRAIGRVHEGPARVTVDGTDWHGVGGWEAFD